MLACKLLLEDYVEAILCCAALRRTDVAGAVCVSADMAALLLQFQLILPSLLLSVGLLPPPLLLLTTILATTATATTTVTAITTTAAAATTNTTSTTPIVDT
jgi:hypothetical protein